MVSTTNHGPHSGDLIAIGVYRTRKLTSLVY
jgi:hypothetical protein